MKRLLLALTLSVSLGQAFAQGAPPPVPSEAPKSPTTFVSKGEVVEIPNLGFTINPPVGWEVIRNGSGAALLFQAPKPEEKPGVVTYRANIRVMQFDQPRPMDDQTKDEYSKIIMEKYSTISSSISNYLIRSAEKVQLQNGTTAYLYYAEFMYSGSPTMQMHILVSTATNHFLMTYTDLASVFEAPNSPGLATAYTSMQSVKLDSIPPERFTQYFYVGGGILALLFLMLMVRVIRVQKMKRLGERIESEDGGDNSSFGDSTSYGTNVSQVSEIAFRGPKPKEKERRPSRSHDDDDDDHDDDDDRPKPKARHRDEDEDAEEEVRPRERPKAQRREVIEDDDHDHDDDDLPETRERTVAPRKPEPQRAQAPAPKPAPAPKAPPTPARAPAPDQAPVVAKAKPSAPAPAPSPVPPRTTTSTVSPSNSPAPKPANFEARTRKTMSSHEDTKVSEPVPMSNVSAVSSVWNLDIQPSSQHPGHTMDHHDSDDNEDDSVHSGIADIRPEPAVTSAAKSKHQKAKEPEIDVDISNVALLSDILPNHGEPKKKKGLFGWGKGKKKVEDEDDYSSSSASSGEIDSDDDWDKGSKKKSKDRGHRVDEKPVPKPKPQPQSVTQAKSSSSAKSSQAPQTEVDGWNVGEGHGDHDSEDEED